jgi:hypothetical protein
MRLISAGSLVRAQSGPPFLFSIADLSDYRLMRLFLQLRERFLRLLRVLARWINFDEQNHQQRIGRNPGSHESVS